MPDIAVQSLILLKKFFVMKKALLAVAFMFACAMQAATGTTYTVAMKKVVAEVPDDIEESDYGHRSAPVPTECVIDATSGITFTDADAPEFVSYDILDTTGMTVASFADEESFISTLFSLSGEYQLRLVSDDYIYQGWIML